MKQRHGDVLTKKFPFVTHGMKEGSETFKKSFPASFKRYIVRMIKTVNSKTSMKKARENQLENRDVMKHFKKLPTTFMVAGTSKRCTLHPVTCPTEFCQYATMNKKIIMTRDFTKIKEKMPAERRTRIFYRPDKAKTLANVFMTYDEMRNCKFEPNTGSLNPHFKAPPASQTNDSEP